MTVKGASNYITCSDLIDFIAEYIDGTLPPAQRFEFERHLAVCPSCVAYLDGYRKTIALGQAAALRPSDDPASGLAPEGLIRAVRAARHRG